MSDIKHIIAVDIGTSMGYAACPIGGRLAGSGTCKLGFNKMKESPAMRPIRMSNEINRLIGLYPSSLVVFEEVKQRPKSVAAGHVYGELRGALMSTCHQADVPFTSVTPGTWKKALTGKGNANKDMIKDAVNSMGYSADTYDEADAIGILFWYLKEGMT